jgi:hypothetical protein
MPKHLLKLGVVLMATLITAGVGGWGPLALAAAKKVKPVAPVPRFTDNHDGTVTDNLTGLIWLKKASCLSNLSWSQALTAANTLVHGQCDLMDGSQAGD